MLIAHLHNICNNILSAFFDIVIYFGEIYITLLGEYSIAKQKARFFPGHHNTDPRKESTRRKFLKRLISSSKKTLISMWI